MKSGIELIAEERQRQIDKGYDTNHDSQHDFSKLTQAASCYIDAADLTTKSKKFDSNKECIDAVHSWHIYNEPWELRYIEIGWPWEKESFKPTTPLRDLVKAGALIAAAIDRLQKDNDQDTLEAIKEEKVDNANKVEHKFNVGDWIVFNGLVLLVNEVVQGYYRTISIGGIPNSYDWDTDNVARLWTIQDAKDGDVLAYETDEEDLWIMIYRSLYEHYEGHVHYHALLVNDNFSDKGTCCICIDNLKPATKEQRDTLKKSMADAGWEFDFEKKGLKKIERKPAWSEEDENILKNLTDYFMVDDCLRFKEGKIVKWLESLKQRVKGEKE